MGGEGEVEADFSMVIAWMAWLSVPSRGFLHFF